MMYNCYRSTSSCNICRSAAERYNLVVVGCDSLKCAIKPCQTLQSPAGHGSEGLVVECSGVSDSIGRQQNIVPPATQITT